jgi:hypothetical protein
LESGLQGMLSEGYETVLMTIIPHDSRLAGIASLSNE